MLKTSSTKPTKPRKGEVRVGSVGKNRAEPVGKHELDGVDNGGGCSGDFDITFLITRWRSRHCSFVRKSQ